MDHLLSLVSTVWHALRSEFVLGVCASLFAAVLFPVISELGGAFLARVFGWLPMKGKTNLSNTTWRAVWHVQSARFPSEVVDEQVRIRQLGNRVFMKFKSESLEFIARGTIDGGRYVTGIWQDKTEGGYHGAFQLVVDPKTRNMSGRWVGYSMQGTVKEGLWVWERNAA